MKTSIWALAAGFALASIGADAQTDPGSAMPENPITTNAPSGTYNEAVIQVVFSDETDSEHPLSFTDLENTGPQLNSFFSQLSYGKLNFQTTFIRVHLSNTSASYGLCHGCGWSTLTADAVSAAIAKNPNFFVGVTGVSVLVLAKYGAGDFTYFSLESYTSYPGLSQPVLRSLLAEKLITPVWGTWAHEFGHQLEVVDGSVEAKSAGKWMGHPSGYNSGYDLMDSCYPCHESSFGLLGAPYVTDARTVFPGWLDSQHVASVPIPSGPVGQTFVLPPLSQNISTPVIQAVQIPIDAAGNRSYWVNARQRLNDDTLQHGGPGIHSEGIQIQYTDINGEFPVMVCIPVSTPGCTNTEGSDTLDDADWPFLLWQPGQTFSDPAQNIKVDVVAAVTGGYEVNITRDVRPGHPDLYITPWLTPPENNYETVDIWVDSICNGYGKLRYGRRADGTVIGSGDDPCVNHENRVYATIHNIGDVDAAATTASFRVSNPLGVGVTGSWTSLGTAAVPPIKAGQSATVFVDWTPVPNLSTMKIMQAHFQFHSCIQVNVAPVPGEIVTTNNNAQENITYFEAVAQGPAVGVNLYPMPIINGAFNLTNSFPGNSQQYSLRVVSRLPAGWTYSVNGGVSTVQLFSGQTANIPVEITPPASPVGQTFGLKADALTVLDLQTQDTPHPSWYVAGGLNLTAHTVLPSKISVAASVNPPGNSAPAVDVMGTLVPAVVGAIVTIDLYSTAGSLFSEQVTVGTNGHFAASVLPGFFPTGVRAIWQGNMLYSSAVAAAAVVTESLTTTSLASNLNPSNFGSAVTFTATVNHTASATPNGSVTFKDGSTVLGTVTLSGGAAAFTTSALAVGSHSITATFSGDFNYVGSTSPVLTQTVNGT